jgi:hypothetical protein
VCGGILDPVVKRLLALMVALAVVSGPVALAVCQITCESKAAQPLRSHAADGHAAHHHMPTGHAACPEHAETQSQLSPVEGPCDHGAETPPSLVAARNVDTAVSLVATLPTVDSIRFVPTHDFLFVRQPAWLDRLAIPLAAPLRV